MRPTRSGNPTADGNPRRHRLLLPIFYLWALPTTSVGFIFIPLAYLSGGCAQWHTGVLELHGGLVRSFLIHCTLLPGGASAMTLGHIVLGRDRAALDRTRTHERVHVRQVERWGPFFLPAYVIASIVAKWSGQDGYRGNRFEREAFEKE